MVRPSQSMLWDAALAARGRPSLDLLCRVGYCVSVSTDGRPWHRHAVGLGVTVETDILAVTEFFGRKRRDFIRVTEIPLANFVIVSPLHQIDMDMVLMLRICSVAKHCRKASASRSP